MTGKKTETKITQSENADQHQLPEEVRDRISKLAQHTAKSAIQTYWDHAFTEAIETEMTKISENCSSATTELSHNPSLNIVPDTVTGACPPSEDLSKKEDTMESSEDPLHKLDRMFTTILEESTRHIIGLTKKSTEFILDLSSHFIDEKATTTLQEFHDLYFGGEGGSDILQKTAENVNIEVDQLISDLQSAMKEGKEINESSVEENEEEKFNRLNISGLQKRLETIISLDAGIREQLVPVLHSMQFEDILTHRLNHITLIWKTILSHHDLTDHDAIRESLSKIPTSVAERESFYRIVLKREPPPGIEQQKSLFDILF
ncbi:MAG: hypothetical protein H6618_07990 [Deltaproteobacteria bacterium]|nr:hypothetical protein [Deltaproteobacteria bacterium]